ncbi:LysE family translocator [Actimicrobium sp. CCI2.3]|uniref:LysE family translocator n=1 Tax=Actimicrobium sp. CCI2.3 TaxID=3048616 RepID=UPI002AB58A13|nr:LysE family translocator [Actimicrobium sp. CCI2.3]MDY7575694.1 LysE family translocator [Actimicrobium sp. CCI2.3]MEB0021935.1 LysE family translocator [Actimicrobium sp. CCI2.3]
MPPLLVSLLPLVVFAFVSSITPGPNNIMLTSSGIRFGFMRSIPHMLGIAFGFGVMLALCAMGIGSLILAVPALHLGLKVAGSGYLVYLAWQLRRIAFRKDEGEDQRPMSFLGAALFQFANPKAWVMAITGVAAFLPEVQPVALAIALFCLVFCAVNLPCIAVWAGAGSVLRRYLAQPKWQRVFCVVMVVLTLYAAAAIWM